MSLENVKSFYNKLTNDSKLAKQLREKEDNYNGKIEDPKTYATEILIPIAKEIGIDISYDDISEYEESLSTTNVELDFDNLDAVSGGTNQDARMFLFKKSIEEMNKRK